MVNEDVMGLLVMAYGTPQTLEDVEPYYTHIRGGRPPSPEALEELIDRYRLIGGRSPLLEITRRQADGIATRLARHLGMQVRPYLGMKHTRPFIAEAVANMVNDGVRRAVALVMAPQYSSMSIGGYLRTMEDALSELGNTMVVRAVDSWHTHPGYVEAMARRVRAALNRLPEGDRADAVVLFTAHSLPTRILEHGDPYPEHFRETAAAVARSAGTDRWEVAYQSAGRTADPWLGPDVCDVIPQVGEAGARGIVICPVGFVADHLEILYDVDIEARAAAAAAGLSFARTDSPNDAPDFLDALADVAARQLEGMSQ